MDKYETEKNDLILDIMSNIDMPKSWLYKQNNDAFYTSSIIKLKRKNLSLFIDIDDEKTVNMMIEIGINGNFENCSKCVNLYQLNKNDNTDSVSNEIKNIFKKYNILDICEKLFVDKIDVTTLTSLNDLPDLETKYQTEFK